MMTGGDPTPLVPEVYTRDIVAEVPVLARIAEIETRILFALDSSDMQPHHWVEIAQAIHAGLCARDDAGAPRYQGVVVVHGTDTMAYTASAVAFLLRGVDRPVVFTGAQRPLSEVRTDARDNLVDACYLATQALPEVGIAFGAQLYRGCRATKLDAWGLDAFGSPGCPPLAMLGVTLEVGRHLRAPSPPEAFDPRLETNVLAVRLFPGLDPRLLYAALRTNIRGLVLVAFGSGNLPQRENSLIPVVRMATERDIPVVVVSQCPRGAVDLRRYEGGTSALAAGAIGAGTMSIEAATAKLMVALGRATEGSRVAAARQAFAEVWAGEVD